MSWRHWACLFVCLCVTVSLSTSRAADEELDDEDDDTPAVAVEADENSPATREYQYFQFMRIFADTFEQVDRNYVREVDRRKLIEAALRGMMEELDPY